MQWKTANNDPGRGRAEYNLGAYRQDIEGVGSGDTQISNKR